MNVQYHIVCVVNFRLLYYNLNIIKFNSIKLYSISPCFLLSAQVDVLCCTMKSSQTLTPQRTYPVLYSSFNCNAEPMPMPSACVSNGSGANEKGDNTTKNWANKSDKATAQIVSSSKRVYNNKSAFVR